MGFKDSIAFVRNFCILLFIFLLIIPNTSIAQPGTLELHRIWAIDLDRDVTALKLADMDGDGVNEIFLGLWDGDSGYIEVFSGFNGILIKKIQRANIPGHKIIDLDVGDIDGDSFVELVIGADTATTHFNSRIILLYGLPQSKSWQKRIEEKVKCIEVADIDGNGLEEAFIGAWYRYSWNEYEPEWSYWYWGWVHKGKLYHLLYCDDKDSLLTLDSAYGYQKFIVNDIDNDSYNEILCGTFFASAALSYVMGGYNSARYDQTSYLQLIKQDKSLVEFSTLLQNRLKYTEQCAMYDFNPPPFYVPYPLSLATGDCDSDESKEIITCLNWGDTGPILMVVDAMSGNVQDSIYYSSDIVSLTLFDVHPNPSDEILIAHSNGILAAINGTTFDTLAISDPLPPISFYAFGDVTDDVMPEICISDGDSLYLFGFDSTYEEEEDEEDFVSEFVLHQNFPNPFNPQTNIKYYLPQSSRAELCIYNIKGQKVRTLVNGFQTVGFKSVTWDGTNRNGEQVASGVYFYKIKTDYSQEIKKMVLLK